MVKLGTISFTGKCERHPNFSAQDGPGSVKGGCPRCQLLLDIFQAHTRLAVLIRNAKKSTLKPRIKDSRPTTDERQTALF